MRNKERYNESKRVYMLDRYYKRRAAVIEVLGGKCAVCGSVEDLEIDHRDATEKSFNASPRLSSGSQAAIDAEVAKCQLLCVTHHKEKSLTDAGQLSARTTHGTVSSYRYCKCDLCREAHNEACREYKRRARQRSTGVSK